MEKNLEVVRHPATGDGGGSAELASTVAADRSESAPRAVRIAVVQASELSGGSPRLDRESLPSLSPDKGRTITVGHAEVLISGLHEKRAERDAMAIQQELHALHSEGMLSVIPGRIVFAGVDAQETRPRVWGGSVTFPDGERTLLLARGVAVGLDTDPLAKTVGRFVQLMDRLPVISMKERGEEAAVPEPESQESRGSVARLIERLKRRG